ncbi:MAG: hypothetical protein ABSE73_13765 [Planctomycetota bacterium]
MRTPILALLFIGSSLAVVAPAADEEKKDKPAATAPAAGEVTKTGTIGVKSVTAAADVVAMFYTPDKDYKLLAAEDEAGKLEELAKKKTKVKLTGTIAGDKFTVTQVVDLEHHADDKGGKDKGDKGDKGDRKKKKDE